MAELTLLKETSQQLDRLGSVDFVVGIASQDHASTIGSVVEAAWTGLEQACPAGRKAVIHVDTGSRDDTGERARSALSGDVLVQISAVDGAPRLPGAAPLVSPAGLELIFRVASQLNVQGCVVLEAGITGISPDWITGLLTPVTADNADLVVPIYRRHRFAGTLTTSVVYPFIRALYGRRIRYPVASEFGCSARLLQHFLAASVWRSDLARLGIEVWLTTEAIVRGFRLAQTTLGVRTQATGESTDLSGTLARVLGALFLQAERSAAFWQKVRGSQPVATDRIEDAAVPESAPVDRERALDAFLLGERNLTEIWARALPPLALLELRKLARLPSAEFRFPDVLWARIVYDFALAYRMRVMNRDHLLSAFAPLYSGWLASFIGELENASETAVEARIEQLCLQYEAEKPYLISRWRWPDRFNP